MSLIEWQLAMHGDGWEVYDLTTAAGEERMLIVTGYGTELELVDPTDDEDGDGLSET